MKGQFKLRKYNVNENYFNSINNNIGAYILGFISADGGVFNNRLTIAQSGDEGKILLEKIKNKLNSNHTILSRKGKKIAHRDAHVLIITSPQIVKDLKNYNIIKNKKYNFKFPDLLDLKYLKPYIRGYFDGDGCVGIYYEKKERNNKIYNSKYLKLSFYGTKIFILRCNELLPTPIMGRILLSKDDIHAEIIWTNKKARNFGEWLFEKNDDIPEYVKIKKYLMYIKEFNNTPKVFERASKAVLQKDNKNNVINEYKSVREVKRLLHISIGNCLIGLTKSAGGYKWEYK